jgi:23S rRNA pseudouridine2605 synthase
LQVVAATGVTTYKKSFAIIASGHVTVNGQISKQPTTLVDPEIDEVFLFGSRVKPKVVHKYVLYNKPRGQPCCTLLEALQQQECEQNHNDVFQQDDRTAESRLYLVNRLDTYSCGLQLLASDSELARKLARAPGAHGWLHLLGCPVGVCITNRLGGFVPFAE